MKSLIGTVIVLAIIGVGIFVFLPPLYLRIAEVFKKIAAAF